jgi:type I restriction enzyme, S subunit
MSEWKEYKIGEISSSINRGFTPNYVENETEGYIVLNQKCIRDSKINFQFGRFYNKNQRIKESAKTKVGDILINSTGEGTLGRSAMVCHTTKNLAVDSHITILRVNEELVSPAFISKFITLAQPIIENFAGGSTGQTELSRKDVSNLNLKIPTLPTQHRIASILSAYDDLIENNNRRIALLEQMAEQIYKEWFVRMRFPGYENTEFEKGVPKGWEWKKLQEICSFKYGTMPKSNLVKETGYPIFSGYGITGYYEKYMFKEKTLIVVARGVGGTGDVKLTPEKCWLTNLAIAILPDITKSNIYFLLYYLSNIGLRILDSGSAQSQITINDLGNFKILLPSFELQKKFQKNILLIFEMVDNLKLQTQTLKQTRDLLLPRLISGKLRVKDVEKEMEKG